MQKPKPVSARPDSDAVKLIRELEDLRKRMDVINEDDANASNDIREASATYQAIVDSRNTRIANNGLSLRELHVKEETLVSLLSRVIHPNDMRLNSRREDCRQLR